MEVEVEAASRFCLLSYMCGFGLAVIAPKHSIVIAIRNVRPTVQPNLQAFDAMPDLKAQHTAGM